MIRYSRCARPKSYNICWSLRLNFFDEKLFVFTFRLTPSYIFVIATFRSLCHPAFFRILSNWVTFREFTIKQFIYSTREEYSWYAVHIKVYLNLFLFSTAQLRVMILVCTTAWEYWNQSYSVIKCNEPTIQSTRVLIPWTRTWQFYRLKPIIVKLLGAIFNPWN